MIDTTFILAAAGAVALALFFALWPLLSGHARQVPAALVFGLVLAIPAGTFLLYRVVGTPAGLQPEATPAQSLNQAIGQLTRRLERDPDNFEGWLLLGLTYKQLEQFTSAEQALHRAVMLDETHAHAKVELAETILFARGQRRMPDESRLLLEQTVELDPRQQKALWLLGIADAQIADYAGALSWWERLDAQLEDGSVRDSVREQMAYARGRLESTGDAAPTAPQSDTEQGRTITATIALDPRLGDGLDGDETVFVYALAIDGPPMPLAIQRLRVDDLPATVQLSDQDAMTPEVRLSQFPRVTLTARVSFSGDATAHPGDLQGISEPIENERATRTDIVIDQVLEH